MEKTFSSDTVTTISIIIPTLNEATQIVQTIQNAQTGDGIEIIIVDAGSEDNTIQYAQKLGVKTFLSPQPGRAAQMNFGATQATGDILLFLHADTQLPPHYDGLIRAALAQPGVIAGAFQLGIDSPEMSLRLVEKMVSWRSRFFQLPYGDQALFLTQETFKACGGFPDLPIMEDFEFVRRLKRQGKIVLVSASVSTSARRWQKLGVFKTTIINQIIILGYFLGISPQQLRHWYRQQK
ncbi:MAG: TIGR04283 family arsenosugar biosynthesis glycosyltransferase [Spirulinaceae cyanobacterium]